jgi:hypothetical protein
VKTRFEQRRHPSPPETRNIDTSVMRRRGGFHHVQVYSTGTPLRVLLAIRGYLFASAQLDQTRGIVRFAVTGRSMVRIVLSVRVVRTMNEPNDPNDPNDYDALRRES